MSVWILVQIVVNLCFFLALFVVWSRLKRPPQDDPRLSRGLQLLQSKISVLEDLSDRTELQVKQINALLDEKSKQMRKVILKCDETRLQIHQSMAESLKVAEIFQDRIPHEEIIERQNTVKYVKAARMAHQGKTAQEIAVEVDLPEAEVEFITKVNRDQLMFNEEMLPAWAVSEQEFSHNSEEAQASLEKISREFKEAVAEFELKEQQADEPSPLSKMTKEVTQQVAEKIKERTSELKDFTEELVESATHTAKNFTDDVLKKTLEETPTEKPQLGEGQKVAATVEPAPVPAVPRRQSTVKVSDEPIIRKVQFPKIDVTKNLG